ncbi:MAG: serine/threonine protein kinase [Candidatus Riflebacteria bacterium]|nr:serine/threonine protein kinase [Candidatus Riflebacteria bacterium]
MKNDSRQTIPDDNPDLNKTSDSSEKTVNDFFNSNSSEVTYRENNSFKNYNIIKSFPAQGGEADIFLVQKDDKMYILKLFRQGITPKPGIHEILKRLHNASPELFVEIFEFANDESSHRFYEIQEYLSAGTLDSILKTGQPGEYDKKAIVKNISEILVKIHNCGIIHLDLKPQNLLIRKHQPIVLALTDFGISSILEENDLKKFTRVKGTSLYQSPESLSGIVGYESDWWSLGVIILEMLAGEHPFEGLKRRSVYFQIATKGLPIPDTITGRWRNILEGLLTRNPEKRWAAKQVSAWLNGEDPHIERDSEVNSSGSQKKIVAKLTVPKKFMGRLFESLEECLEFFSSSPETWETGVKTMEQGHFVAWMKNNHELETADRISRIVVSRSSPSLSFFRLICSFCPDIRPKWRGEIIDRKFIEIRISRIVSSSQNDSDSEFIKIIFNGELKKILEESLINIPSDIVQYLNFAGIIEQGQLASAPINKKASVLKLASGDAIDPDFVRSFKYSGLSLLVSEKLITSAQAIIMSISAPELFRTDHKKKQQIDNCRTFLEQLPTNDPQIAELLIKYWSNGEISFKEASELISLILKRNELFEKLKPFLGKLGETDLTSFQGLIKQSARLNQQFFRTFLLPTEIEKRIAAYFRKPEIIKLDNDGSIFEDMQLIYKLSESSSELLKKSNSAPGSWKDVERILLESGVTKSGSITFSNILTVSVLVREIIKYSEERNRLFQKMIPMTIFLLILFISPLFSEIFIIYIYFSVTISLILIFFILRILVQIRKKFQQKRDLISTFLGK